MDGEINSSDVLAYRGLSVPGYGYGYGAGHGSSFGSLGISHAMLDQVADGVRENRVQDRNAERVENVQRNLDAGFRGQASQTNDLTTTIRDNRSMVSSQIGGLQSEISQIARDAAACCCETQKLVAENKSEFNAKLCDTERALADKITDIDRANSARFNDLIVQSKNDQIADRDRIIAQQSQNSQTEILSNQNDRIAGLLAQLVANSVGNGNGGGNGHGHGNSGH